VRIALVAGEASGDTLGAALIEALRRRFPGAEFAGVAGPRMISAGCTAWFHSEELGVMGLTEVLRHLPRLFRIRSQLQKRILDWRPDVFIGVDFKEFNLGLARRLKKQGLRTVQYVSPQVWAWRPGRARTIGEAVDLILCLFPFEPDFYREYGVRATFVGHPLADQIPLEVDRAAARAELGLATSERVLAVLPGSRRAEVERLADVFAGAAELLVARFPGLLVVAPMVTPALRDLFARHCASAAPRAAIRFLEGNARLALAACDVALVASGTATLEAALCKRPMVVAYRLGAITAFLLRNLGLVKVRHFSQPNLLAGKELVPEFFQGAANPQNLADALARWFERPADVAVVQREFTRIHENLRRGGAELAAAEIGELVSTWTAHASAPELP
jgi:lipid-A-disaccharide synthase